MSDLILNITTEERLFLLRCIHMASKEGFYEVVNDTPVDLDKLLDKFDAGKQFKEYIKHGI